MGHTTHFSLRLCHEVIFFCCCCGGSGGVCGVCWTCVGEGVWGGDVQHQAERTDCWGLCGCVWTRGRGSDAGVCLFVCGYGGTNEDWMAVAEVDPSTGGVECTFARPDAASYLFFNSFSAGIVAGENNVPLSQIQVYDNSGLLLEGEAYVLDSETNTIVPGPSFEGLISRISITNH